MYCCYKIIINYLLVKIFKSGKIKIFLNSFKVLRILAESFLVSRFKQLKFLKFQCVLNYSNISFLLLYNIIDENVISTHSLENNKWNSFYTNIYFIFYKTTYKKSIIEVRANTKVINYY